MPRNSGGTYSLPAGNPVASGSSISSAWANNTLNDLKSEMTDSLSRSGKGGMSAALGLFAGTQAVPGLSFSDDTDNGLYYKGADNFALVIGATELLDFSASMAKLSGTAPIFRLNESDAAANNKLWDFIASGEDLKFRALTDALAATDWLTVTRTGGVVDSITLAATSITLTGYSPPTTGLATLAGNNAFTGTNSFESASPLFLLTETDGAANNKSWRVIVSGEELQFQCINDALNSATGFMTVNRTNNTCDSIAFTATAVTMSGTLGVTGVVTGGGFSGALNGSVGASSPSTGSFTSVTTSGNVELGHASDTTLSRVAAGRVAVEGLELGYRGLPSASVTTGAFAAADAGKCVNATGGVTVPNSTMAAGDVVVIDNQSGGAITITASITTLTLAGTTSTGNRTLAANGLATIKFRSSTSAVISGTGVT